MTESVNTAASVSIIVEEKSKWSRDLPGVQLVWDRPVKGGQSHPSKAGVIKFQATARRMFRFLF